jgi:hypothetical protein
MGNTNQGHLSQRKIMKYKNKMSRGFLLIDALVYIALCAILGLILFRFITNVHKSCVKSYRASSRVIAITLPFDVLRRDMLSASRHENEWNEEEMVFDRYLVGVRGQLTKRAIGWLVSNERLWRVEGEYDFTTRGWIKKSKSLLCKHVKSATWKLMLDKTGEAIEGANIELVHDDGVKRAFVRLRAKRV